MGQGVGALHHIALRVEDVERAVFFYHEVLGLPVLRRNTDRGELRSVWLSAGLVVVMLETALRGEGPSSGSAHVLAFEVADLGLWTEALERQGVAIDDRTDHTLYVRDPDGHRVGLTIFPTS
jgi:catechol 2,3-dioxygenase-like lactoylglutathione lyase family enzyme